MDSGLNFRSLSAITRGADNIQMAYPKPALPSQAWESHRYRVNAGNRTGRQDTSISNGRFGPLELRIRPMGFPAMPVRFPVLKVDSDSQNDQFLMILVRP